MGVRPLYPEQARIQVENGHLPYAVFNPSAPREAPAQPGILSIHSGAPSSTGRFLVALNLVRPAQQAASRSAQIEKIEGHGCVGARLGQSTTFFRDSALHTAQYADWKTDAETWTVSDHLLSAGLLTSLMKNGKVLFESDRPASFAAEFEPGSVRLTVSADQPLSVRFSAGSGKTMELKFAAGQHEMRFSR
jgi:hypothetical protein